MKKLLIVAMFTLTIIAIGCGNKKKEAAPESVDTAPKRELIRIKPIRDKQEYKQEVEKALEKGEARNQRALDAIDKAAAQ